MSAGQAPFSFHCIICIESFNLQDRPPVILPCGHTYVCAPCSKRLDKCMECRTSLFLKPQPGTGQWSATSEPLNSNPANDLPSWYRPPPNRQTLPGSRSGQRQKPVKPPPPAEPIALPLPKNLVMMAMMEAAEQEARAKKVRRDSRRKEAEAAQAVAREEERKQRQHGDGDGDGGEAATADDPSKPPLETVTIDASNMESIEKTDDSFRKESEDMIDSDAVSDAASSSEESSKAYESGDDDSAVRTGMEAMFTSYGTYAVRERSGLTVLPCHPSDDGERDWEGEEAGQKAQQEELPAAFDIKFGQTVQIVEIDAGSVATLARGEGFIVATSEQLVKIGAPLDKACQIEGMIRSAASKRRLYEKKMEELARLHDGLMGELVETIQSDGEQQPPVIGPVPATLDHDEDDSKENKERRASGADSGVGVNDYKTPKQEERTQTSSPPATNAQGSPDDANDVASPDRAHIDLTPRTPVANGSVASTPPGGGQNHMVSYSPYTIDNSEIGPFCISSDEENEIRAAEEQMANLRMPKPLVRQDSNQIVDQFSLGCGFLANPSSYLYPLQGNDDDSLVGLSFDSAIERQLDRSTHSNSNPNSNSNTPDRRDNRPTSDRAAAATSPTSAQREGGQQQQRLDQHQPASSSRSLDRHSIPDFPRTPERSFTGLSGVTGAASFDTVDSLSRIDFRSGLSGHRGLLGARSHADRMRAEQGRRGVRMMGEHRGIASIRPMRHRPARKKEDNATLIESFRNMSRFMRNTAPEQTVPEFNR